MGRYSLDLEWGGQTWTFSDELSSDVVITSSVGLEDRSTAEPRGASVTLDLAVDVPARVEAGNDLLGARAELSLDSTLIMTGRVRQASFGDPTEPLGLVRLDIEESSLDDSAMWPGITRVVSLDTWTYADRNIMGRVYPEVWGQCGYTPPRTGSPAYLVDTGATATPQYMLVADGVTGASSVIVYCVEEQAADTYTIVIVQDGLGQDVSVIDLFEVGKALNNGPAIQGQTYYARWPTAPHTAAAGDLLLRWMARSSVPIDTGRTAVAVTALNRFVTAGFVDDRVRPMDWINDNMLGLFPFTWARSGDGLYPVVLYPPTSSEKVVAKLVVSPACVAIGPVTYAARDPISSVIISYALRAETGNYDRRHQSEAAESYYAGVLNRRYATRGVHDGGHVQEVSTDIVEDDATAQQLAAIMLRLGGVRWMSASYRIDRDVWGFVEPGHWVSVTDPDRSWTARIAWVSSRTDDLEGTEITVAIEYDPARDG